MGNFAVRLLSVAVLFGVIFAIMVFARILYRILGDSSNDEAGDK